MSEVDGETEIDVEQESFSAPSETASSDGADQSSSSDAAESQDDSQGSASPENPAGSEQPEPYEPQIPGIREKGGPDQQEEEEAVLAAQVDGPKAADVTSFVDRGVRPEKPEQPPVGEKTKQIINEVINLKAAEIRALIAAGQNEAAYKKLEELVPARELDALLAAAGMAKEILNPDLIDTFLRLNMSKREALRAVVSFFHVEENRKKIAAAAAENADDSSDSEDDEDSAGGAVGGSASVISEAAKEKPWDKYTQWYEGFSEDAEKFLDETIDVSGLIKAFFAIDSYGSGARSAFSRGIESKQEDKEAGTLSALTKIMRKRSLAEVFFVNLIKKEPGTDLPAILPLELNKLLTLEESQDKGKQIALIKEQMSEAIKACRKIDVTIPDMKVEDLNLSETVMQLILTMSTQVTEKPSEK